MKKPGDRDDPVFNTLAEAGARLAHVGCLIGMSCGLTTLLVGVFTERGPLTGAGVLTVGGSCSASCC